MTTLRLKGGTTAQNAAFTGAAREVTVDTEKDTLVVHDGVTVGGNPLIGDTDPRLSDARAPTGAAGGVLSGTYPNPGFAADMATQAELDDAINLTTPRTSATGSAIVPAGTEAQRDGTPAAGYLRFNADVPGFEGYDGAEWGSIGGGGGAINGIFYENDILVTADYTISTNKNAMSAGPIEIDTGITVTVPVNSVWSIV